MSEFYPGPISKGATSNQVRANDGHHDFRGGVLRLFAFVACLLLAVAAFWIGPSQPHPRMQDICFGIGSFALAGCLALGVGFAGRAIRRYRANRKVVLFHNRRPRG